MCLKRGESGLDLAMYVGIMVYPAIRQHPRFPLRLPVLCESPAIPDYGTVGLTQNVNQGGLLLEVPQPLAPGTPMSLLLCTGDQNAGAEVVVVWRVEDPPSRMSLRFTTWERTHHLTWKRLLAFQASSTPRASVRIPIALEVTCRISPETRLPGHVENLSDGGLMISLAQALPLQTRLTVVVPPSLMAPPVDAEMEVVWTQAAPGRHGMLHGLCFCADDIGKELFIIGTLLRQLVDQEEASREKK